MLESRLRALKTRIGVRNPTGLWNTMSARWIRGKHYENYHKTAPNPEFICQQGQTNSEFF